MRKHKNLNKQELMIRQDIPCVHLGGGSLYLWNLG